MAQQIINTGINPNDSTGDPLRLGGYKINSNFTELYTAGSITMPGYFPNLKFPPAYVGSCGVGHNDLYTCPAGRKAMIVDILVTNDTGFSVTYYPEIKIGGVYYRAGLNKTENTGGTGHNYGMTGGNFSQTIILNAGESFSVNSDTVGMTIWITLHEFDVSAIISRATIINWVSGVNTLFTCPANQTIMMGTPCLTSSNQPQLNLNGVAYNNECGTTRVLGGFYTVPSGGTTGLSNQWAGSNTISNHNGFSKYFGGGFAGGDSMVIVSDSSATGQFAWCNYIIF